MESAFFGICRHELKLTHTHTRLNQVYLLKVGSGNPAIPKMGEKKVHSEVETGWARRAG